MCNDINVKILKVIWKCINDNNNNDNDDNEILMKY